ncbi:MAG: hypothetical protein QGH45_22175 [Myxococcota bacterium]|nr:hypothetical protein [Myxococcota bacterium]
MLTDPRTLLLGLLLAVGCAAPAGEDPATGTGTPAGSTLQVIALTPDRRRGDLEQR